VILSINLVAANHRERLYTQSVLDLGFKAGILNSPVKIIGRILVDTVVCLLINQSVCQLESFNGY